VNELLEGKMSGTLSLRNNISTRQEKIAQRSRQSPSMVWTTLAHHIDVEWLAEAYRRTRKDGAVGVDGVTAEEYEASLLGNLESLLERLKTGNYQAPPVRRVYIPKEGAAGKMRPLGIPTLEDKILQRAVLMALEPIYEQDFLDCSYGFRPDRGAHKALQGLRDGMMALRGAWVIDLDIQSFFDTVSKKHLAEFLDKRVRDGVIRQAIGKWLNAGIMDEGKLTYPEAGTPQGGVLSPLLSNIYLHEVLDCWFERDVKPRLLGRAFLVRYADDAVLAFANERDARRVMDVLAKRFGRFGLTLHPAKTRLVDFRSPPYKKEAAGETDTASGSFDMLGFTLYWGRSRKGYWVVLLKTAKKRFARAVRRISEFLREALHRKMADQQLELNRRLQGHFAYFGITGNSRAIGRLVHVTKRLWHKWLGRRSNSKRLTWTRFNQLLRRFPLVQPRIVHRYYAQ
jgi:group II intron reverse transcriptase/maturase